MTRDLDDVRAPGTRVQQVDVLRHHRAHVADSLERRERDVPGVGLRCQEAADPRAVQRHTRSGSRRKASINDATSNGSTSPQIPLAEAEVRDAALGRHAGARAPRPAPRARTQRRQSARGSHGAHPRPGVYLATMDGYAFTHHVRVRFAETDAQGIAHHASFVVWLEDARVAYLAAFAGGYQAIRDARHRGADDRRPPASTSGPRSSTTC